MKLLFACDCDSARQLSWLDRDQPLGAWSRRRLNRHIHGCAACREFAEDVAKLSGRFAPLLAAPVHETLVRRLRAEAAESASRERRPVTSYRWLVVTLPAAAAALLFFALIGRGLLGRFDRARQLDARLDRLQTEVVLAGTGLPAAMIRASMEDHLGGLEDTVRCLETEVEDNRMDSSMKGATCLDS